jgi:chorismate synthase
MVVRKDAHDLTDKVEVTPTPTTTTPTTTMTREETEMAVRVRNDNTIAVVAGDSHKLRPRHHTLSEEVSQFVSATQHKLN